MIQRLTQWHNDKGQVVQVEACILTDWWDPLCSFVKTVGPFDEPAERGMEALALCLAWFHVHGVQAQLWDDPVTP